MPSVRFDETARQAIVTLASMANDDICVHIGDNSADDDKHAFLRKVTSGLENVRVSYHASNLGAEANWLHLVREQTTPFICMAADDDVFSKQYFSAALDIIKHDPGCTSACGLMVSIADRETDAIPYLYTPSQRTEARPVDRVRNYTNQNSIAYALMDTKLVQSFADYVEENPIKCPFNDYLLAFHVLSTGNFRIARQGYLYAYNNNNWDQRNAALAQRGKFYASCGLPEAFGLLERLHWALANAHFFLSRYRSPALRRDDAAEVAVYLYERMAGDFIWEWKTSKPGIEALFSDRPDAMRAVTALTSSSPKSIRELFDLFATILGAYSPDLALKYVRFLEGSLLAEAGACAFSVTRKKSWLRPW